MDEDGVVTVAVTMAECGSAFEVVELVKNPESVEVEEGTLSSSFKILRRIGEK